MQQRNGIIIKRQNEAAAKASWHIVKKQHGTSSRRHLNKRATHRGSLLKNSKMASALASPA